MSYKIYDFAEDCPNCGQKDSYEAYKGARMGSTAWGHRYMCCSEKCGREFLNSPTHKRMEVDRINKEIAVLKDELKTWRNKEG